MPKAEPLLNRPPRSEAELLERAHALAGRRLGELARSVQQVAPANLLRNKGWVGQLIEHLLGATAGSRDSPDFEHLGVELKTLPVDRHGHPVETTFVATIPLHQVGEIPWEQSRVCRKLSRVLWVPVEGERPIPVPERRVGAAMLWSPSVEQEAALRFDWEELAGIIGRGDVESISGRFGRYLQVRPKAAHSRVRRRSIDAEGHLAETMPRGFYLRICFTAQVLRENLVLPR